MRVLLIVLLFAPAAQAVAWEDPVGDHEMGNAGAWAPAPEGWYPRADVVRMEMSEEDASRVRFEVEVASLDPGGEPVEGEAVQYGVTMVGHPRNATWMIAEEPDGYWAWFVRDEDVDAGGGQERVPQRLIGGPAQRDGDVLSYSFAKGTFTAEGRGPSIYLDPGPRAGDSVRLRPWVGRHMGIGYAQEPDLRDMIGPVQELEFKLEAPVRGDLELFVEHPYRGSNGAATTYLFDVSARNEGTQDHTARVGVEAPPEWVVRAPYEITVPSEETIVFPVAVSVPFNHEHGTHKTATVRTVASDGTEASAAMHVYWHDPPQPGGHHPRVALKAPFGFPQFDTGPAPDSGAVGPWSKEAEGTGPLREMSSTWFFGLSPSRSVGLDFDSDGTVEGTTSFELPQGSDVRLTGRLLLTDGPVVAEQVHSGTWEAGVTNVQWKMPVLPGIDTFSVDEGGNLAFEFVLEHNVTDPSAGLYGSAVEDPVMPLAGNGFHLPLSDFHEQIDLNAVGVARLSMYTLEPARLVNPGEVAVVPFQVANHAANARGLEWTLNASADWITMQEPPRRLAAGENASFVVVAEPGDLPDGTTAQVLLIARDVETGIEAFGRVAVTVTTGQDLDDERFLAPAPTAPVQETPLPFVLVLAALAGAARRHRTPGPPRD